MSYRNPTMLLIVVAAIAAGFGLWLGQRSLGGSTGAPAIAAQAATLYPGARDIPPFSLAKADGTAYTNADLQGRWTLLFFGFTRCPDVCPTTLASLAQLEKTLAQHPAPPTMAYVFVSVDPERDSVEQAANYAKYFSPSILGVTGEPAQLDAFTKSVGVLYMKAPAPGETTVEGDRYTVDHSAQLVIVDPAGRVRGMFRPPLDPNKMAADLVALAEKA